MDKKVLSFQDLIVWQKSVDLVVQIFRTTLLFPKTQVYVLVSQIQRCANSIPSNIAEGYQRNSRKEYIQFLYISHGSCAELRTQLIISQRLGFIKETEYNLIIGELIEVEKMLKSIIRKLSTV